MKFLSTLLSIFISTFTLAQSIEAIAEMEMKSHLNSARLQSQSRMDNPEIIDVTRYDLTFNLNPEIDTFSGTSIISFTTLDEITEVTFDAQDNLNITQVSIFDNSTTNFVRNENTITIELGETIAAGTNMEISIDYNSSYANADSMYMDSQDGVPLVYTLSEPFGASTWWIGKDNLKDKADVVNVYVVHPDDYKVGSNGVLISSGPYNDNGDYMTHWRHAYPIPAYLISIAMTNYEEYSNAANINGTSVPIINYVFPSELNSETMAQLDAVPSYLEFFSDLVSDYPYIDEKYGHCQFNWGGGMEHTTMTSQVHFGTSLTAHEMAHQWFGDKVTCGTWSDIWLNEGFATYFDALLRRNLYGEDFFKGWKEYRISYITYDPSGSVYIPEDQATTTGRIFSSRLSYNKGAMVLNMLRFTLGDDDFYQAIRNYQNDAALAYGFAVTNDLQEHLEAQSGRNLDDFFADWVYGEGHPVFDVDLAYHPNENAAILTVNQTQSHSSVDFFETDFDVQLIGTNGETELRRLSLSENNQTFNITDIPFALNDYEFNPNYNILCLVNSKTLGTENVIINHDLQFQLYPNPAVDAIFLMHTQDIQSIEIYNAEGKLVLQKEIDDTEADVVVNQLSKGVYFLKAYTASGVMNKKFVKK